MLVISVAAIGCLLVMFYDAGLWPTVSCDPLRGLEVTALWVVGLPIAIVVVLLFLPVVAFLTGDLGGLILGLWCVLYRFSDMPDVSVRRSRRRRGGN